MICERCNKIKKKHIRTHLPFDMGDDWVLCCPGQDDNEYDEYKAKYPKVKFRLALEVVETEEGKHSVHHTIDDFNPTMKEVGLVLYQLKKIEQILIDRVWDNGGEGYEITKE